MGGGHQGIRAIPLPKEMPSKIKMGLQVLESPQDRSVPMMSSNGGLLRTSLGSASRRPLLRSRCPSVRKAGLKM